MDGFFLPLLFPSVNNFLPAGSILSKTDVEEENYRQTKQRPHSNSYRGKSIIFQPEPAMQHDVRRYARPSDPLQRGKVTKLFELFGVHPLGAVWYGAV